MKCNVRIPITEIFASYQGEGIEAGMATVFVRVAGCNRSCAWCDTKGSQFAREEDFRDTGFIYSEMRRIAKEHGRLEHYTFTGGEPLLYADQFEYMFSQINTIKARSIHCSVETNGDFINLLRKAPTFGDCIRTLVVSPKEFTAVDAASLCEKAETFLFANPRSALCIKYVVENLDTYEVQAEHARFLAEANLSFFPVFQPMDGVRYDDVLTWYQTLPVPHARVLPRLQRVYGFR